MEKNVETGLIITIIIIFLLLICFGYIVFHPPLRIQINTNDNTTTLPYRYSNEVRININNFPRENINDRIDYYLQSQTRKRKIERIFNRFNLITNDSNEYENIKNNECCICLEKFCENNELECIMKTICDHYFHKDCIFKWLKDYNINCPICREEFTF